MKLIKNRTNKNINLKQHEKDMISPIKRRK